ncbi:MAG: autotransporter outer membrane beta-barrel domain-containing protein, partial [Planctomycetes bacterium]|nr:autotransporter outer membrane beta-barrel domain-containing protein [Planctomycetota bacterium]
MRNRGRVQGGVSRQFRFATRAILAGLLAVWVGALPAAEFSVDEWYRQAGSVAVLPGDNASAIAAARVLIAQAPGMGLVTSAALSGGTTFGPQLSRFDSYLVDSFGNAAEANQPLASDWSSVPGSFTIQPNGVGYFQGPSVLAVLDGALLYPLFAIDGLPVSGMLEGNVYVALHHNLLGNSTYCNYGVLTEAELAVFKDLGYDIDLKSQFGHSIYDSNTILHNTTGFSARNAAGDGWVEGVYNGNVGAIGLHVYGANNTVVQAADILSAGAGSAGIRIDGVNAAAYLYGYNSVTVAPDVKVHAHGADSNGVLVAYGKNHVLSNRGEIAALGEGGVGVRFDFGTNVFGDEYRGSYKWVDENGAPQWNLGDLGLDGALVSRFDVTGTVAGRAAAMYIGETALVEQINIMSGAALYGDIVSEWDRSDPRLLFIPASAKDFTTLTFGLLADSDGSVVPATADPDFTLTYQGNIIGRKGLAVQVAGGTLSWQGTMDLIDYTQESGATLLGIIGQGASVISADTVTLMSGSSLGVTTGDFQYGRELELGSLPVLTFDTTSFNNAASLAGSGGVFAVGAYDYTFGETVWLDARTVGIEVTSRRVNPQRTAASATTAPLALALSNPAGDAVFSRGLNLFQGRRAAGLRNPDLCPPTVATGPALWASPVYGHTSRSGGSGYSVKNWGVAIGMDKWFSNCLFAGAALVLDFPEYRSHDADINAHRVTGALYGGALLPAEVELGVFTAFGTTRHHQKKRHVLDERYSSRYNAETIAVGASLGRSFLLPDDRTVIRPFTSYDYTHLHARSHGESAGVYALDYRSTGYDLHRIKAGTGVGWMFHSGAWLGGQVAY